MDKVRIITGLLLAMAAVTTAQSITFPSLQRKGAIEEVYVSPTTPTTAAPVVLHVTVADALKVDRIEKQQIGSMYMIRIYWTEPSAGSYVFGAGHAQESLGVLAKGTYRLFIQSLCNNLLAGSKQLSFEVVDAPTPTPITMLDVIDNVWVTPYHPTTSETAVIHVAGTWPTAGYVLSVSITRLAGRDITVDLYWTAPQDAVAQVETPFTYESPVKLNIAGTYVVHVRVYLAGQLVDSHETSVEAKEDNGTGWSWPWVFPWDLFPQ